MTDWHWLAILALPVGYLRLVAHELSHAAACITTGGRVDWARFMPWPHKADGRWFWGRMYRTGGDDLVIYLAPVARAGAFMGFWLYLAIHVWHPLFICAFWELTDVLHWWRGWFWRPQTDGGKTRALLREGKDGS